jgi:hypothetical protein
VKAFAVGMYEIYESETACLIRGLVGSSVRIGRAQDNLRVVAVLLSEPRRLYRRSIPAHPALKR